MSHSLSPRPHAVGHADEKTLSAKATAAVVGAAVGDAASLGLHWVYDAGQLKAVKGDPEFAPSADGYHKARAAGDCTMYGETELATLRSLRACKGWDAGDFAARFAAVFGPGGSYNGYLDHATKGTLLNAVARDAARAAAAGKPHAGEGLSGPLGADDKQCGVFAKLVPVVAMFAGHRELPHLMADSIRATHNNEEAVLWGTFCGRVLEAALMGAPIEAAIAANLPHLEQPFRAAVESAVHAGQEDAMAANAGADYAARVAHFGQACSLGNAVPAALYLAVRHGKGSGYAAALRENILAGGDSCGRALLLGALLAAEYTSASDAASPAVPAAWLERCTCKEELQVLAEGVHVPVTGETASEHVHHHSHASSGGVPA